MTTTTAASILQIKIRLLNITPMIWRRILIPEGYTLHQLHGVIQTAMGKASTCLSSGLEQLTIPLLTCKESHPMFPWNNFIFARTPNSPKPMTWVIIGNMKFA